jgi:tripartite-type tricarboxylate transporter receptor subunit TctC
MPESANAMEKTVCRNQVVYALLVCAHAGAALPPAAAAPSGVYPAKSIRFVVPFTPGGSADIFARAIGQKMSDAWGQQVVIDNRGGSAGIMGSEIAAKAPADGHTLMMGITANIAINPGLYPKLPYDPVRDFAPVTLVAAAPYAMLVTPSLPAKSVVEFIALAKAKPGQVNYASTGSGSAGHLTGALFGSMAGVKIVHVPYKNIGSTLVDIMAGQVQMMFVGIVSAQPHIKAGKLRAIGISGAHRSRLMPELPTVAESGVRGFEVTGWYGVFVPAATPRAIVIALYREIVRILHLPDVGERLSGEGAELIGNTPDEFAAYIKSEIAKWSSAIKISGARPD